MRVETHPKPRPRCEGRLLDGGQLSRTQARFSSGSVDPASTRGKRWSHLFGCKFWRPFTAVTPQPGVLLQLSQQGYTERFGGVHKMEITTLLFCCFVMYWDSCNTWIKSELLILIWMDKKQEARKGGRLNISMVTFSRQAKWLKWLLKEIDEWLKKLANNV